MTDERVRIRTERVCKRCKVTKPLDRFPRDTTRGVGYRRFVCKACCAPHRPHLADAEYPRWMTGLQP